MILNSETISLIDQRIRAARDVDRAVGTVASVDASLLRAAVTFDGSALAVPVKMAGGVNAQAGDRVALNRYGSDWVITATFAVRWPDDQGINVQMPVGTTTSATFVGLPGSPLFMFTKRWTPTRVRIDAHMQAYSTINTTTVVLGCRFNLAGVDTDVHVVRWYWSEAFVHTSFSGTVRHAGLVAGTYTITPVWARWSGGGTLSTNADDWLSFSVAEIGP